MSRNKSKSVKNSSPVLLYFGQGFVIKKTVSNGMVKSANGSGKKNIQKSGK